MNFNFYSCLRASKAARMKEEDERAVLRNVVERLEASKASLEELREERRCLVAEFRARDAEWRREIDRKRDIFNPLPDNNVTFSFKSYLPLY